jgi:hypothetical protein
MKMKLKVTTAILMSLFLVGIIAVSTHAKPAEPSRMLMVDIIAKGDDMDIPGYDEGIYRATTLIVAKIEFDKVTGVPLGRVEFHIKIYDESGKKVYMIKGKLKDGMVIPEQQFVCDVRGVTWTNLWLVMGLGMIKTTDIDLEIVHRGQLITLPNTGGKYVPAYIVMMVSPNGENLEGEIWDGWAFAGVMENMIPIFGGVTYLTKYMEKWVP